MIRLSVLFLSLLCSGNNARIDVAVAENDVAVVENDIADAENDIADAENDLGDIVPRYWNTRVVWENWKMDDPDCVHGVAQPCWDLMYSGRSFTMRDIYKCWAVAPSKCWYVIRIQYDGTVPETAICFTQEEDTAWDLSGYRPSMMEWLGRPGLGNSFMRMKGEWYEGCNLYLRTTTYTDREYIGTAGKPLGRCKVKDPEPDLQVSVNVGLFYNDTIDKRSLHINNEGGEFIGKTKNLVLLKGAREFWCGTAPEYIKMEGPNWNDFKFWGSRGYPKATTSTSTKATQALSRSTHTPPTWYGDPIRMCEQFIRDQPGTEYPGNCPKYCALYIDDWIFCPGVWEDMSGEYLMRCILLEQATMCYDSRQKLPITWSFKSLPEVPTQNIEDCREVVVGKESRAEKMCKDSCNFFGSIGGSRYCKGSYATAEDLIECVATLKEPLCSVQ